MVFDMAKMLGHARSWLADDLVSGAAHGRLAALARGLPPMWEWGILEARLAPDQSQVDFMVCVGSYGRARAVTARMLANPAHREALEPARALLACWADGDDPRIAKVPVIWLEYDLPDTVADAAPAPLVSLCLDPAFLRSATRLTPAEQRDLAERGLCLLGASPSPMALTLLERCAASAPERQVLHVNSLLPRGSENLKLVISLPDSAMLPGWLDTIGWPGDRKTLSTLLAVTNGDWHSIEVQLEIGEELTPYLSVELHPSRWAGASRARHLGERLVEHGVAMPEKVHAAFAWVGATTLDDPELPWTLHLERRTYLKLVVKPDDMLEAKAYLAFRPSYTFMASS